MRMKFVVGGRVETRQVLNETLLSHTPEHSSRVPPAAQHDWPCMVLIDLIVNGQTCVAQNNFVQHDCSCMGRINVLWCRIIMPTVYLRIPFGYCNKQRLFYLKLPNWALKRRLYVFRGGGERGKLLNGVSIRSLTKNGCDGIRNCWSHFVKQTETRDYELFKTRLYNRHNRGIMNCSRHACTTDRTEGLTVQDTLVQQTEPRDY
jgi:hypothetical protein